MTPDSPDRTTPTLSFCTRCGARVAPYAPSTVEVEDMYDHGLVPSGLDAEPHYWCERCRQNWLATNLIETGWECQACHTFMPAAVSFCGACGARMWVPPA